MATDVFDKEFTVGAFRIDRLKGSVSGSDENQHLPPKAMEVLVCLARNAGELVTRQDLAEQVWGNSDVSDQALTHCISDLRHAFHDHSESPEYIQTIPKRGYRLIAPVTAEDSVEAGTTKKETTLWQEIQRRKVVRVAVAYAGIAWLLIQFADTVFPFVGISQDSTSLVVALIILGFPVAIVAAWMIERTSSGLILDKDWVSSSRARLLQQRNLNISLIAVSIIAISIAANILVRDKSTYAFAARDWVVLTHVENLTGDPLLDESLDRALRIHLSQSPFINVLPEAVVSESLVRMQRDPNEPVDTNVAIEIAIREGARAVVAASIIKVGNTYNLTAEALNPDNKAVVASRAVTADSRDNILGALEILVDGIRTDLGESQKDDGRLSGVPLERVTTSSLAALNAFSIANQRYQQGDAQSAIDLLNRAIEIDSEFASAYAELGVIYSNMGRPPSEYAHYWETALNLGDRLPEKEKLRIQATMSWLGKPDEMRRAWTLASRLFPDDAVAHHNLGVVYLQHLNQGSQALDSFERAASLPNADRAASLIYLGYAQLFANRLEDAVASFHRAYGISQNPFNFALADGYIAMLRYQEAKTFLDEFEDLPSPLARLYRQSRFLLYHLDRGEFDQSLEALDQAISLFDAQISRHSIELGLLGLAILEHSGDSGAFDTLLAEELVFVDQLLGGELSMSQQGYNPVFALRIAAIAARTEEIDNAQAILDAESILREIDGYPVRHAMHEVLRAEISMARGDLDEAVTILEESIDRLETFDARVALGRAQALKGNTDEAIRHFAWVRQNRGRAFGEWHEELTGRELNIIDWSMAADHLARIHEDLGNVAEAANFYDQFIEHWRSADRSIPRLNDATNRRAQL